MEGELVRIVGFDCAEEEHVFVLLSADGVFEQRSSVVNRRDHIEDSLAQLKLSIEPGAKLVVVVESKRSYGFLVAEAAQKLGCEVWQVSTVGLNHFRDVEGQPRKDDEWDAFLAARMVFLRTRGCREILETTEEERVLSRLTRSYERLSNDKTNQVLRLRAVLLELAPEVLHRAWDGPKPNSQAMLYLLERWPGFEGMERTQLRSIERVLHKCRYGDRSEEIAKLLRDMARRISITGPERSAITLELGFLAQQITMCNTALKKLLADISARVECHPIGSKLLEMNGIGPVTAGVLLGELLPVARTATESQCATYAGVTPLSRKSGKSHDTAHLTRGSNKRVLHALYSSSVAASKHSAIDKAYFKKKVRHYAGHKKPTVAAYIALSRQRHKLIYILMTTNARYDKERLIASHLDRVEAARAPAA